MKVTARSVLLWLYFLRVIQSCQVVGKHITVWPNHLWLTWVPYIFNVKQSELKVFLLIVWNVYDLLTFDYFCSCSLEFCSIMAFSKILFGRVSKAVRIKRPRKFRYCTYLAGYNLVPKSKVVSTVMLLHVFVCREHKSSPWHALVLLLSTRWNLI